MNAAITKLAHWKVANWSLKICCPPRPLQAMALPWPFSGRRWYYIVGLTMFLSSSSLEWMPITMSVWRLFSPSCLSATTRSTFAHSQTLVQIEAVCCNFTLKSPLNRESNIALIGTEKSCMGGILLTRLLAASFLRNVVHAVVTTASK